MPEPSLHDSSQELFHNSMQRPVIPPTPPVPPPVPPEPTRPRLVQPAELRGATAPVPPPPPPVASAARAGAMPPAVADASSSATPSRVVNAGGAPTVETADAQLPGRSSLKELRRDRRRQRFRQLPGYTLLEALWLRLKSAGRGPAAEGELPKRQLPAWLVSFVFHVSLILILALIPLAQMATEHIQVIIGDIDTDGDGAQEFTLTPQGSDIALGEAADMPMSDFASELPELQFEMPALASSLSSPKTTDALGARLAGMAVQHGLSGRSGSLKGALLGKYGGNSTTEAAVQAALKWLAKQQRPDGSWSLQGPYSDGGADEDRTAATAMALNAFLGNGHTHKSGEYSSLVDRGLKFLIERQDKEGFFAGGEPSHNQMYSQAIATIAVCEAYGMTGDSQLRTPAAKAIKFAEWSQSRQKGWRYVPREDSDLSVTGWYMMALMTGKMAGLEPREETIRSVEEYLEAVSHDYGARYSYQRPDRPTLSMTAEGLLCRQYLGWPSTHSALQRAIENDLLPAAPSVKDKSFSVYYWYYATQVLHHVGGKHWNAWNQKMRVTLPALQVQKGKEAGSWDPDRDEFGPSGGRLYVTCFMTYCLEVYYRHLSIYDVPPEATERQRPAENAEDAGELNPGEPNAGEPNTGEPNGTAPTADQEAAGAEAAR